ncbi:NUDIX hydrolase [Tamlana sp. I1]|uniref:NUDIX hydrolase n=1 Tax=Tamlana sp. I1 TaxID=2762061 RepID=UPI00188EE7D0|nr:CoA pyrophosphatase [Tamlana sp. I1]
MNFDVFLQALSKIENIPLLGEGSHFKMVPPFRQEQLKLQKEAIKTAKQAGVLALFYPDKTYETNLVLILRKTYKGVHSAQVGFPGGKLEPEDVSIEAAAIRETFEEVGVPLDTMKVVKKMTPVYIPPSHFYVHPFIAFTKKTPKFKKQDDEVEAIIEVSLKDFLDDAFLITKNVKTSYSLEVEVPAFNLEGHVVWGATAMMLSEIKDLLKDLFNI